MASQIFQKTFVKIDTSLATYINDVAESVITEITPVVTVLLLIYMTLWGWMVITGKAGEVVTDGFNRIIKITIIVSLAINLGYYNSFVVDLLSNLPDKLAELASITATGGTGAYLDNALDGIWRVGWLFANKAMAEGAWIADIPLSLAALAIWIFGGVLVVFAAFLMILSKMALSVLLGVGPIFILLTLFEPTKRFFDSWFGQCMNFILIVMLVGGILRLIVSILTDYLTAYQASVAGVTVQIDGALPAVVLSGIGLLVLKQVMPIASALGGGMALSSLGAGRGVGQAFNNWDSRRMQNKMHKNLQKPPEKTTQRLQRYAQAVTQRLKRSNSVTKT